MVCSTAGMPVSWKLWVVAAAPVAFAALACQAPPIEGTPYGGDTPAQSGNAKKTKAAPAASGEPQRSTSSAETQAASIKNADAGSASPSTTTTATTPQAPPQPNCANADDQVCFFCCLDANPNAAPVEESFDSCSANCLDQQCVDSCAAQHLTQCAASAACSAHHACLKANGCFVAGLS